MGWGSVDLRRTAIAVVLIVVATAAVGVIQRDDGLLVWSLTYETGGRLMPEEAPNSYVQGTPEEILDPV